MNLLAKKPGMGILGMLILFLSCEDPSDIGLILTPDDQVGVFFKEFDVPVHTTLIGNIETGTRGGLRAIVGAFNDPDFGSFNSRFNGQFYPERFRASTTDTLIPSTAEYMSAKLNVNAPYYRSIQFGVDQTWKVFRLHEQFEDDRIYMSTDTISLINPLTMQTDMVGEGTFSFIPGVDTVENAEISIPLDDNFGMTLYNTAITLTDPTFDSVEVFLESFKGLSIVPDDFNNAVFGFDLFNTEDNNIEITYTNFRQVNADSSTIDTLSFIFPFYNAVDFPIGFNSYTTDRTGTVLEPLTLQEDLQDDNGLAFIQGGTGVFMRMDVDTVFNFLDQFEFLQINRVDIVMEEVMEYQGGDFQFNAPNNLQYFLTDSTNRFITSLDPVEYSDSIRNGANLQAKDVLAIPGPGNELLADLQANNSYSTIATLPFQDLIDNPEFLRTNFLLTPIGFRDDFSRVVVEKEKIKVRVYYTTLKE